MKHSRTTVVALIGLLFSAAAFAGQNPIDFCLHGSNCLPGGGIVVDLPAPAAWLLVAAGLSVLYGIRRKFK